MRKTTPVKATMASAPCQGVLCERKYVNYQWLDAIDVSKVSDPRDVSRDFG
jgi:hypothetical protein